MAASPPHDVTIRPSHDVTIGAPHDFTVRMDAREGTTRVHLRGDLNVSAGLLVTAALAGLRDHQHHTDGGCGTVLLDLSAVTVMDSSGLTAITDALSALTRDGCLVRLIHARPEVGRLLAFAIDAGWLDLDILGPG